MDWKDELSHLRTFPPAIKKQIIDKLKLRIQEIQVEKPWLRKGLPDMDFIDDEAFQDLCGILFYLLKDEELDKLPPWCPDAHHISSHPSLFARLFVTPRAYRLLFTSNRAEATEHVFQHALKLASGDIPLDRDRGNGVGYEHPDTPLALKAMWPSPDSEVYMLLHVYDKGDCDPHYQYSNVVLYPERIPALYSHCLEIFASWV